MNPEDPAAPDHLSKLTERWLSWGPHQSGGGRFGRLVSWTADAATLEALPDLKVPMTVARARHAHARCGAACRTFPDLTVVIDHMADSPLDSLKELEKLLALEPLPEAIRENLAFLVASRNRILISIRRNRSNGSTIRSARSV